MWIKNVIIGIGCIYLITVIERFVNKDTNSSELLIEHAIEKAKMSTKIEDLNSKIHDYELEILKVNINVLDLSNDQVDSVWSTMFD
tara:strand:+ start:2262 stop:2519 length:258 start_codon:yes stop_codon:yes gene_type:complete